MIRRLKALLWLRTQLLIYNKNLLVQFLFPYLMLVIYRLVLKAEGAITLFMCLSLSMSMSCGTTVSSMIAEEKEKHNQRALLLSGVSRAEYLMSVLIYPMLLTVLNIALLPIFAKVELGEHALDYAIITVLTSLAIILSNVTIGFLSATQTQAQMNSLPIMLLLSLSSILSQANDTMRTVLSYTFFGAFSDLSVDLSRGVETLAMGSLVVWILVLGAMSYLVLRGVRVKKLPTVAIKEKDGRPVF